MDSVNREQILTVDNVLVLIADMVQKKYSAGYIVKTVGSLRHHRNMAEAPEIVFENEKIKLALANVNKLPKSEDSWLPVTVEMIEEWEKVADRDLSPKSAVMVKGTIWLGFTCMLRRSEYHKAEKGRGSYALKEEGVSVNREQVSVTFAEGWKYSNVRWTLDFNYIPGTEEKAYRAIKNYIVMRKLMAPTTDQFLVTEDGAPLDKYMWSPFFNHLVDHSAWVGAQFDAPLFKDMGGVCLAQGRTGHQIS